MRRLLPAAVLLGFVAVQACGKTEEKKDAAAKTTTDCDTSQQTQLTSGSTSASGSASASGSGSDSKTGSSSSDSQTDDCPPAKPGKKSGSGSKQSGTPAKTKTTAADAQNGGDTSPSASDTTVPTDATLGKVEAETTETGFAGKSAYATLTDAAGTKVLSFLVMHADAKESQFKKVKDWGKCIKCVGTDDKHCKTPDASSGSISVSFLGSLPGADAKVDKTTGFPKGDANTKKDQTDFASGLSIALSTDAQAQTKGSFNFTKRPAKVGDDWAATADFMFGTKKYKATVSGKVFQTPKSPAPPSCDFKKEYLDPTYESN